MRIEHTSIEHTNPLRSPQMLLVLVIAAAAAAREHDPYQRAAETWISIRGTVEDVGPNAFGLDYGDGVITVETDDEDREGSLFELTEHHHVTVNGKIDDDFYRTETIEASVYVDELGGYIFADTEDEDAVFFALDAPLAGPRTVVRGFVTSAKKHVFTLGRGSPAAWIAACSSAGNWWRKQ